jgi:prepilin-type N-terminal cleavage/methylation domain-containing protein
MKTPSQTSRRGFTLIELLVAMAITTIIITVLVSVTAMALETWNRSRAEIRAARQAKSMIDTMARDFESLVVRKGNSFEWLLAKSKNPNDSDFPKVNNDNNKASPNVIDLIFFSAATDRYDGNVGDTGPSGKDEGGDVSTVGYQLAYKDPISASGTDDFKTFVLYRKLLDPDETFGVDVTPGTLGKTDLQAAFTSVIGSNPIQEEINFICENVYEFTVTFHVRVTTTSGTPPTTTTRTVRIPVSPASNSVPKFSVTGAGNIVASSVNSATVDEIKSAQLSAVEISLTVLSDFGLKQLRARTFTNDAAAIKKKAEFIAKHSYQYSKVVQLPGS